MAPSMSENGKKLHTEMPKISVIIPVYNVEPYLRECLDSVVNQTLRDIEIICVNDGSTDNSGAILAEYAAQDKRITIITQENRGLSAARNVGMDVAKGKYIYFIDSDDYIDLDALEILHDRAEELELDLLCYDFINFCDGIEGEPWQLVRHEYGGVQRGEELLRRMRDENAYAIAVWTMLYHRVYLQKIGARFREGAIYEDITFTAFAMLNANRVSHIGQKLYHYRIRPNSITQTTLSSRDIHGYLMAFQDALSYGLRYEWDEKKAHEIWRTAKFSQENAKHVVRAVGETEKRQVKFENSFVNELYQHFVLDSIATEDELTSLRQELVQVRNDVNQQREESVRLNDETVRLHNENSNLLATINNLNSAITTANEKISTAEQLAAAAWREVDNIRRSATYRIGRVITWAPRMVRGFIRCYHEHGWRYTWQRVVAHLRRER